MTIKDIAKECGCGVGTVSRVLNNHPDVSDDTRAKVMSVVDKYGFVLNKNASLLKSQDSKTIEILVKGTSNALLNDMLSIVLSKMEGLSYNASVVVLDEYENEAFVANRVYYERKPQAMIFLGGNPDKYAEDFEKIKIPCVLISNEASQVSNTILSSISTDDIAATEFITEFLIKQGHKKIGLIGGDIQSSEITRKRYEGFLKAIRKYDLDFDESKSYAVSKYSFEGGAAAARQLIDKNKDITAIVTMSDSMAIGACRSIFDMGLSVPDDISVTGFDGLPYADYYNPRITTIKQQADRLAAEGLAILLNTLERNEPARHELIPFEFINRESVKKRT